MRQTLVSILVVVIVMFQTPVWAQLVESASGPNAVAITGVRDLFRIDLGGGTVAGGGGTAGGDGRRACEGGEQAREAEEQSRGDQQVAAGEGRARVQIGVELGAQDYGANGYLDTRNAVPLLVFQQPGSNALATADHVRATIDELSQQFPQGLKYDIVYDPTRFISESVREVVKTILAAVALVVIVVIVFLQTWRACASGSSLPTSAPFSSIAICPATKIRRLPRAAMPCEYGKGS